MSGHPASEYEWPVRCDERSSKSRANGCHRAAGRNSGELDILDPIVAHYLLPAPAFAPWGLQRRYE